jgi:light-regulated signal transduction histidine kinase (bacteriophytochrome)
MQELINDLLTHSRVGSRALDLQRVDVNELVDNVIGDLGGAIEDSAVVVTHDDLPRVQADPTQLVQLFQNLIANGIKFRTPHVHLRARTPISPEVDWGSSCPRA